MTSLWIGTYPSEVPGAEGIWSARIDPVTGALSGAVRRAHSHSPSFLALHPQARVLFAVDEREPGMIHAFAVPEGNDARAADGGLARVWSAPSGGGLPCHITIDDGAAWISNYGSGTLTTVPLGPDGLPVHRPGTPVTHQHSGRGPDPDRQRGPHVHSTARTPDGRFAWVADLGTDEIRRYRIREARDGTAGLEPNGIAVRFPAGTGPRHMAIHPDGLVFVAGELGNRVHIVQIHPDDGSGTHLGSVPGCVTPPSAIGAQPSHIALNAQGTRLFLAVRGTDVVSTFRVVPTARGATPVPAVIPDAADQPGRRTHPTQPILEHLGDTRVSGLWPRHFVVLPIAPTQDGAHTPEGTGDADASETAVRTADRLVIANQNSRTVVVIDIDSAGNGTERGQLTLPVPPSCVVVDGHLR